MSNSIRRVTLLRASHLQLSCHPALATEAITIFTKAFSTHTDIPSLRRIRMFNTCHYVNARSCDAVRHKESTDSRILPLKAPKHLAYNTSMNDITEFARQYHIPADCVACKQRSSKRQTVAREVVISIHFKRHAASIQGRNTSSISTSSPPSARTC